MKPISFARSVRLFVLPLLAIASLGMAKKKPDIVVRFHVETHERDGAVFAMPVKFQNPPRAGFAERVPSISERDIRAIYPTQAPDGSFGCVFALTVHGRLALQTLSNTRRGSTMVVFVSTKSGTHQVIDMLIDKPISDGIIFIPRGLSQLEVQALAKAYPVMGQPKRKRGEKPQERAATANVPR